jgi:pyrimidine-specific ribonucleoside hydrolase
VRRTIVLAALLAVSAAACDRADGGASPSGLPSTAAPQGDGLRHVVFDTDLAFDDIMALLYLLRRDDVAIDAVTVTGTGEAHCDPGVRNAQALLALGGSPDTPVACGRETPLEGDNAFPDEWRVAVDDLSSLDLPAASGEPDPRGASGLLLDELEGDTILITLGPLTNVAEALRADPGLADRVPAFVAMAGAVDVPGNTPSGIAEFNVWVDPVAAAEVFGALDVALVPLDATNDVPFSRYFTQVLDRNLRTPEAVAISALIHGNEEQFLSEGYSFWDTLATTLVFRPELASWDRSGITVTPSGGAAGWTDRSSRAEPVRFADGVPDPLAFEQEYLSTVTGGDVGPIRPEPDLAVRLDDDRCAVEPGMIPAGASDVAFTTDVSGTSVAVLVRLTRNVSYATLRRTLGPQGSMVDTNAPALARIDAFAWVQGLTPVDLEPGRIVAVCLSGVAEDDPAPRAWLSRPVAVGAT